MRRSLYNREGSLEWKESGGGGNEKKGKGGLCVSLLHI